MQVTQVIRQASLAELRKHLSNLQVKFEALRGESSALEHQRNALSFRTQEATTCAENGSEEKTKLEKLESLVLGKEKELRQIETDLAHKILERNALLDKKG